MHSPRDPRFDSEALHFRLTFTCEECGHFDRTRDACAHEWPPAYHRRERYLLPTVDVVFCKEFEAR